MKTRKEILKALYNKIDNRNGEWITDFQKLCKYPIGNKTFEIPTKKIIKNMKTWNYHYYDLSAIILYELTIQNLFDEVEQKLKKEKSKRKINKELIEELQENLEDIFDAIENSYITINNYDDYKKRLDDIL